MIEIVHGDCADILAEYEGRADLILTSPPYDALREYGGHGFDFDPVADACVSALAEGGVLVWVVGDAIVDGSETGTSFRHALGFMKRGLRLHQTLIYQRSHALPRSSNRCASQHEYMFVLSNGAPKTAVIPKDRLNLTAGSSRKGAWGMGRQAKGENSRSERSNAVSKWGGGQVFGNTRQAFSKAARAILPHMPTLQSSHWRLRKTIFAHGRTLAI